MSPYTRMFPVSCAPFLRFGTLEPEEKRLGVWKLPNMESGSPAPAQEIETSTTDPGVQKGDWTALIHGARFASNGKYICGYVDSSQELLQVLENYRTITGTGFSNAQSLGAAMKAVDESILQTRFMSPSSRPRLFWQMNAGEPTIPYDGVPFMSVGQNTDLPCVRFGGRRKKVEQVTLPSGSVVPVDFRMKTGCEAKITVRRILRYPSAEYTDIGTQGIAAVRRMRKHILEDLVQKIIAGVTKTSERYYFLLPTPLAHMGHAVPEVDAAPPLAQPVADEIINQLSQGVTDIVQIRDHIKNFVDATLGAEAPLHVNDSAYYPSEYDVFRHIYWLYKTGQVIDQESAMKEKLGGLPGLDQDFNPPTATPPKIPAVSAAETITSVYSIIMDEGGVNEGAAALEQLSESQIRTEREVELNSSEEIHKDMESGTESPIPGQHGTPITIPTAHPTHPLAQLIRKPPVPMKQPQPATSPTQSSPGGGSQGGGSDNPAITQAQNEARNMLHIIENQTHSCKNLQALNTLRRQLTELCSQFSMHLAGVPTKRFDGPPAKKAKVG